MVRLDGGSGSFALTPANCILSPGTSITINGLASPQYNGQAARIVSIDRAVAGMQWCVRMASKSRSSFKICVAEAEGDERASVILKSDLASSDVSVCASVASCTACTDCALVISRLT